MEKRQWAEWSHELAERTQRCYGLCPTFGLPNDIVTEGEFRQSIAGLPAHNVKTCDCWQSKKEPIAPSFDLQQQPEDLLVSGTEAKVRQRVLQIKHVLRSVIDKIAVSDFRIETRDGKQSVVWKYHIPPTLITTVNQLNK